MLASHITINVDCFSETHRITGRAQVTANNGLMGLLNDPNTSLIEVENAYLSRLQEPAKIESHFERVSLNKQRLVFVIASRREELGSAARSGGLSQAGSVLVSLVTASYEIRGTLEVMGKFDPAAIIGVSSGNFLPVYKAAIHAVLFAGAPFMGEAIALNRAHLETLALMPKGKA